MKNVQPKIDSGTDAQSTKRPRIDTMYTKTGGNIGSVSVDKECLNKIVDFVKKNYERTSLNSAEQLDVLLLQGFLHHEHMEKQQKNGPGSSGL